MTDATMTQRKDVLKMASVAINHFPHSVTGGPPALAMTGRADFLAGDASAIFDQDPEAGDIIAKQQNGMRNILNAGNDVIAASARQASETCTERQMPGRSLSFCPVGSTVPIAERGHWKGSCRAIAHASSNLVMGKGYNCSVGRRRNVDDN